MPSLHVTETTGRRLWNGTLLFDIDVPKILRYLRFHELLGFTGTKIRPP
jgi:hypothetical protein